MASALTTVGIPLALIAFLYQAVLHDIIFVVLGVGRHIQDVSEFPYSCRRIEDPRLQACEDMYLSDATRQLFLACSEPLARPQWMPKSVPEGSERDLANILKYWSFQCFWPFKDRCSDSNGHRQAYF